AVLWRDYGFRSDVPSGSIGTASIVSANGTCKAMAVNVTDSFGFYHGQIRYEHSDPLGNPPPYSSFGLNAGWGGAWQEVSVALTASSEYQSCASPPPPNPPLWTGPHIHQQADGYWSNTGPYPSASSCHS